MKWFDNLMLKLGYMQTSECRAESAKTDKYLREKQKLFEEAIAKRDLAAARYQKAADEAVKRASVTGLLRADIARLERERDEALMACEIAQSNRELYRGRYEKLLKARKAVKAPARKKAA